MKKPKKPPLGEIPDNEIEVSPSGLLDFWVLQIPDTNNTVGASRGELSGPIEFETEEDALTFQELYNVPSRYKPTHIKIQKH